MTPWNKYSVVTDCPDCEGTGYVAGYQRPSIHDPYPERPCECGLGPHEPECDVCGFNQIIPGFDCFVCDTVAHLFDADLQKFDVARFSHALAVAVELAKQDIAKKGK